MLSRICNEVFAKLLRGKANFRLIFRLFNVNNQLQILTKLNKQVISSSYRILINNLFMYTLHNSKLVGYSTTRIPSMHILSDETDKWT